MGAGHAGRAEPFYQGDGPVNAPETFTFSRVIPRADADGAAIFKGSVLREITTSEIHTSKNTTRKEWEEASDFAARVHGLHVPPWGSLADVAYPSLRRGGIIGSVEIVDCVTQSESLWFVGPFGFVLRNPEPCTFRPMNGRLGFFTDVFE